MTFIRERLKKKGIVFVYIIELYTYIYIYVELLSAIYIYESTIVFNAAKLIVLTGNVAACMHFLINK